MKYFLVLFLVVAGPVPLVAGVVWTWSNWSEYRERTRERDDWVETEAEIVWCSEYNASGRPGAWPYTYRMQWTDADGQAHQSRSSSRGCTIGRRYSIRYDPEHPERMDEGRESFGWAPLTLSVLGLGFTWIGVKEWWKARRSA